MDILLDYGELQDVQRYHYMQIEGNVCSVFSLSRLNGHNYIIVPGIYWLLALRS